MHREGKNGFNVPFGNYTSPRICDEKLLKELSVLFNKYDVEFTNQSYTMFQNFEYNDIIYMDPPYYPITSSSFVDYTKLGFDHDVFKDYVHNLKHSKVIVSNSYCDWVVENFKSFTQLKIDSKRRINCKNPASIITELLITNIH